MNPPGSPESAGTGSTAGHTGSQGRGWLDHLRARIRPDAAGRSLTWRLGVALGWRLIALWIGMTILVTLDIRHEVDELERYYDNSLIAVFDELHDIDEMPPSEIRNALQAAVAERHNYRVTAIAEISLSVLMSVLIVVPLSLLGLWAALHRQLMPLSRLSSQIAARGQNHLSPLMADDLPSELRPLVDEVNRLLERLRRALDAERSFAGNSAHELRTPIAGALAQTQRLLSDTRNTPLHERARHIETALQQLQALAGRLLELSRAEGAGIVTETSQDLAPLLHWTVDELAREYQATDRLQLTDDTQPLPARLDRDAVHMLLRNLIENALVHGDPQAPVQVNRQGRQIDVINHGPVLNAADFKRLSERFVKGRSGSRGSGLGLSIVQSVIEGGKLGLEIESPLAGQTDGVRVRVTVPG